MTTESLRTQPVTMMFTERVKREKVTEYETWSRGVLGSVKDFTGYLGSDVIRPEESSLQEYITLIRFDSCLNLKTWRNSSSLADWKSKLSELLVSDPHQQEASGLDLWFDRSDTPQRMKEPPYWKQVVIGVICVYPLVQLLSWLLGPILAEIRKEIATLVNVTILSSLLIYPVMPWVTRLLRTWLYPK
jgi:antibiotic biosynthesis monooxygenase (ABM) superfamily enzyme